MATLQELYTALEAADSQGNTEDAAQIAQMIRQAQSGAQAPSASNLPPEPEMMTSREPQAGGSQSLIARGLQALGAPSLSPEQRQYVGGLGETAMDAALLGFGSEYQAGLEALRSGRNIPEAYSEAMDIRTGRKQQFAQENPKTSLAASLAGGLASGVAAAPRSLLGTLALGGVEGAGTMEEDRLLGGALGAGGAGVVAGGLRGLQKLPAVKRGMSNLFPKPADEINLSPRKEDSMARRALAAFTSRTGGVDETVPDSPILSVAERLRGGKPLIGSVAAYSDEGGRAIRESGLMDRAATSSERLRTTTGLDDAQVEVADKAFTELSDQISDIGSRIEARVQETRTAPLKNQERIMDFLDLPGNRGVLKESVDALKNRGKEVQYGAAGDPNQIMINEELAQEIASRLSGRVSALKPSEFLPTNTADYSMAQNLKKQFDTILAESTTDPTLRKLRRDYSDAYRQKDAFESGLTGEGLDNDLKLLQRGRRTGENAGLFAEGTRGNLASGNNLMSRLQNPDTMRRLKTILPEADIESFDTAVKVENMVADTTSSIQTGLDYLNGKISKQTLMGKTQDQPANILEALSGKRAYSGPGAVFLFGNEVLEAIGRTDLPEPVIGRIGEMISRTGPDADRLIRELVEVDIPRFQKEKVLRTIRKVLTNAAGVSAAAAPSSVQMSLSGR